MDYWGEFRSGVADQYAYFQRQTGLSGFTVRRSRNGGSFTLMTTPTIAEVDATNAPGVYRFLLDEDMVIGAGNVRETMAFQITAAGMQTVYGFIVLSLDDVSHVMGQLLVEGGDPPASPIGF